MTLTFLSGTHDAAFEARIASAETSLGAGGGMVGFVNKTSSTL